MRLKAVVSVVVSLMFALTVPTVGITQSENGQRHAAVVVPESTVERPEDAERPNVPAPIYRAGRKDVEDGTGRNGM